MNIYRFTSFDQKHPVKKDETVIREKLGSLLGFDTQSCAGA